jgi:hypothetical protein
VEINGTTKPADVASVFFFLVHFGFMAGQEDVVENLWRKFFSDPLQWWDNRSEKVKVNQLPFNSH